MQLEHNNNEGYKLYLDSDEAIEDVDFIEIDKEISGNDFSLVSNFTGQTIMSAEEVRDHLIELL